MTSATGTGRRTALTWLTDVLFAVTFLAVEAAAVFVIWLREGMAAWAASYDDGPPPGHGGALVALGVVTAFAVLLAVLLAWRRWPLSAVTQGLVAGALALLMVGIAASEHRDDRPAPAPTHGSYRPCLSGGDSHECPGG
ncbi:DUF6234 family protein [Actinomadura sp. NPDC047616]|uniref:DUF6234 family protein n=1 Tax=Actinomadura sp. NPDC047616 TaxID=3155914 RepID=UPI00340EF4C4